MPSTRKFNIVSVASELDPFVKTGGLADVARALPKAVAHLGHHVSIFIPLYRIIDRELYKFRLLQKASFTFQGETLPYYIWQTNADGEAPVYAIDMEIIADGMTEQGQYNPQRGNERFALFNAAVLAALPILNLRPHIIHCHDWHTGLIPYFLATHYHNNPILASPASVFTIHNLSFQMARNWWEVPADRRDPGYTDLPPLTDPLFAHVNFTKRAIRSADIITTVSEWYAQEILTKEYGEDLHRLLAARKNRLFGIVNGIDYQEYNPATDPGLKQHYTADTLDKKLINKQELQRWMALPENPRLPLFALISRLSEQKGLELLIEIMEPLLRMDLQLVILGAGDRAYEKYFDRMRKRHPTKLAAHLEFDTINTTKVYAGADMLLMPSRFEPCGLGQLISLRYGTIPIVHSVGGLHDTITDFNPKTRKGNGFVFHAYDSRDLLIAITRSWTNFRHPDTWRALVKNAMRQVYSWELPARKYIHLYSKALAYKSR